ncbi:DNA helicase RecQ [Halosquirtibacter xylanolyticus]|uniref:DNA helicase RecQ n=1 Tax=Halosquirtibacter xylanolyticus TaxID=3374599 RepID=UPI00374795B2|nr:DNA helicase RecQ [Prolixibacteraceae bacterium]
MVDIECIVSESHRLLKEYFGYDAFRPLQEEIVRHVMQGNDSLVLMPTGGGKSLCFQIPSLMLPGVTVVVSPLISLMKDQVDGLNANGIAAAFLNSTLSEEEEVYIMQQCRMGKISLLYVSPERITRSFEKIFGMLNVSLLAVDEAHCISSWGHDFRPEYQQLKWIKHTFPKLPIIALTATADKTTRSDIVTQLGLHNERTFLASFNRPNLSLEVRVGVGAKDKDREIIDYIRSRPNDSGIIYCMSRKSCEKLSSKLNAKGLQTNYYHAGLSAKQRENVQDDFINDRTPVICATVAFGMGIDKSNVRWVIHYNLPKNVEGYYQEIGRAGRDGLASDTFLYFNLGDIITLRKFAEESGQMALNLEKLTQMQAFAESDICRRKILLSYFGEYLEKDCGNCDVCKNPPKKFDGTIIAQKALSAVMRTKQSASSQLVVDILRGSEKREVLEMGYHRLKTYGKGRDVSEDDWKQYLRQMMHFGLLEVAYDRNNALIATELARKVLFEDQKVSLVKLVAAEIRKQRFKVTYTKEQAQKSQPWNQLFEHLRKWRVEMARAKGIPPYLVFNDATLREIAVSRPESTLDLLSISGVGKVKFDAYGEEILEEISRFKQSQKKASSTYQLTFDLYQKGYDVNMIAQMRGMNVMTVYSHLAFLFQQGYPIDPFRYIDKKDVQDVLSAVQNTGEKLQTKPLYDFLRGEVDYYRIRLSLAYLSKEGKI